MTNEDAINRAEALYREGRYEDAFDAYQRLAARSPDDGRLAAFVGALYYRGIGTDRNSDRAIEWYERAVDAGFWPAALDLAGVYTSQAKLREARELLEKVGALGFSPALYYLGRLYEVGRGVPADELKAYQYLRDAAQRGHVFAQRQIAVRLIKGKEGVLHIPRGITLFVWAVARAIRLKFNDPENEQIRV